MRGKTFLEHVVGCTNLKTLGDFISPQKKHFFLLHVFSQDTFCSVTFIGVLQSHHTFIYTCSDTPSSSNTGAYVYARADPERRLHKWEWTGQHMTKARGVCLRGCGRSTAWAAASPARRSERWTNHSLRSDTYVCFYFMWGVGGWWGGARATSGPSTLHLHLHPLRPRSTFPLIRLRSAGSS